VDQGIPQLASCVIGSRFIPLAYVICEDAVVLACPKNGPDLPYAPEFGYVEAKLIARASHQLDRDNNALVYYYIEEATRSTSYAASIKPFTRAKDGRAAFTAMLSQYVGEDKWRALIKQAEEMIHNRKWKGQQSNFSLEKFIGQHRTAYVNMCQCETHVEYQLPNEIGRVTYLLAGIE
jgi:hypothetical protein